MKPVAYHRLAASEFVKSAEFYERRVSMLGDAFIAAVDNLAIQIAANPGLGSPGAHGTRSLKTRRFPFRIVYLEQPDRIWIIAVAHLSRTPNYWAARLD
jgi:toxin ParE1/3/4